MGFFRSFLASLLAIFVSFLILFFLFIAMIAGLASQGSSDAAPYIRPNTALIIHVSGSIPEQVTEDPFQQLLDPTSQPGTSVAAIRENLRKAATDERITGVWLKLGPVATSWAHLHEIRQALAAFKQSGKFVYASTDDLGFNEQAYYVGTTADSLFAPPQSLFEFDGFYLQPYFLKDLFDKVGIEAQVGRSGSFKTFADTYTRNNLSPENRLQYEAILSGTTDEFMKAVAEFTGKPRRELDSLLNQSPLLSPKTAFDRGLIHALAYPDQVEASLKRRMGIAQDERLNSVANSRYSKVTASSVGIPNAPGSDKIAVIHASGEIVPSVLAGFGDMGFITVNNFKESLDKVLADKNVKALVVRIDSPGGAASTSDILYHMIRNAGEKMPVVALMGSTAASGGYYMAMGADTVIASPFTVTGSIGVISMKYNVQELAEEKLGISFDEVRSHNHADWLSFTRPFTEKEADLFQDFNTAAYEGFLAVVGENRGMTRDETDAVAQGRVWLGSAALGNGLVDVLGGYDDALRIAGEMAGIQEWNVVSYPAPKTFIEMLTSRSQQTLATLANPQSEIQKAAWKILHIAGPGQGLPVARMPVEIRIF